MKGVYFLLKGSEIVYIGKTRNYNERFFSHKATFGIDFDRGRLIEYPDEKIEEMEKVWIQYFKPIFNKSGKHEPKFKSKIIVTSIKKRMKLRKLTEKSFFGFGSIRDLTVAGYLHVGKKFELIKMYYTLSHITFFDNILSELGITPEWQIHKPGVDKEKFFNFAEAFYPEKVDAQKNKFNINVTDRSRRNLANLKKLGNSKEFMARMNQGHRRF